MYDGTDEEPAFLFELGLPRDAPFRLTYGAAGDVLHLLGRILLYLCDEAIAYRASVSNAGHIPPIGSERISEYPSLKP